MRNGGEENDLCPDCGSSFIGIYICQKSLNCTLYMDVVYYVSVFVLYICITHLSVFLSSTSFHFSAHSVGYTFRKYPELNAFLLVLVSHHTSQSFHDLLFG